MNKQLDFLSKVIAVVIIIGLLVGACALGVMIAGANKATMRTYKLCELSDGVYGIYTNVASSIPAENYETIILNCDGQVLTLDGNVVITYTKDNYHVEWADTKLVHGDTIYVYVPQGSIEYQAGVGLR